MGCRSYVASFGDSFQIIAKGFVCFFKKRAYSAVDFSGADQGLSG